MAHTTLSPWQIKRLARLEALASVRSNAHQAGAVVRVVGWDDGLRGPIVRMRGELRVVRQDGRLEEVVPAEQ